MSVIDTCQEIAIAVNGSAADLRNAEKLLLRIQSAEAVPYAAGALALIAKAVDSLDAVAHDLEQERAAPPA